MSSKAKEAKGDKDKVLLIGVKRIRMKTICELKIKFSREMKLLHAHKVYPPGFIREDGN